MFTYPNINPVALDLGFWQIHWYGVMYLLAFISAWLLANYRAKKDSHWQKKQIEDLIFYAAIGVLLGGRMGYFLFYQWQWFLQEPLAIFYIYQGGMSFHGGLLGVILALFVFSRRYQKSFLVVCDFVAPLAPLGLFFGRIGNFINGELWGKESNSFWAMYGPDEYGNWATRHPSQLYEACLEGLLLFVVIWFYTRQKKPLAFASALFLVLYASARFLVEFVRKPDAHLGYLAFDWLTMGQLLSLPMFCLGLFLFMRRYRL